jgi:polyhydroxybutyrate depolymerase
VKWLGRLGVLAFALVLLALVAQQALFRFERVEPPALPGKLVHSSVESGGRTRTFSFYLPAERAERPAIVLALHGSLGDGGQMRAGFGYELDLLAEHEGFLPVYPDGFEGHWNDCRRHAPYSANTQNVDDVAFLAAVVEQLAHEHNADPGRVFATGASNGGQMALRLALEAPEAVRAVAPIIASLPAAGNMDCRTAGRPVSILVMNGTEDPMNPYEGGTVALHGVWGNRGAVLSTRETIDYWRELAGHAEEPEVTDLPDLDTRDHSTVQRSRWRTDGKKDVVLYEIRGGGHSVPNRHVRGPRILGRTNGDIEAAREIWSFFAAAP